MIAGAITKLEETDYGFSWVTARCILTGNTNKMLLPVTVEQIRKWRDGGLIQNVFPSLTADEREFLMTGIKSDTWSSYFSVASDGAFDD